LANTDFFLSAGRIWQKRPQKANGCTLSDIHHRIGQHMYIN
jgi:hypothetical protein